MKLAITGSHRTGKTTLAEALTSVLPHFETVPEPYHQLEEDGYEFPEMPGLEDFELQLELSIRQIRDSGGDVIFDRCPVDLLAYLTTHEDAEMFDEEKWLPEIRHAMENLDFVVFVPIESPDVMDDAEDEFPELRILVDETLRDIVHEYHPNVIEVNGPLPERLRQVLSVIDRYP